MRPRLRLPSPAMAVALIALFVALGGTGYAATQLSSKDRAGAAKRHKKHKRGRKRKARVHCAGTTVICRGVPGPRGPQGPTGGQGATGPQGPGAKHLVYQSGSPGDTSTPYTTIGQVGPWTLQARCIINGSSNLELEVREYGEAATLDVGNVNFSTPSSTSPTSVASEALPAASASSPSPFTSNSAASGNVNGDSGDLTFYFADGSILQAHDITLANNTGATPFCRFSIVFFPVS